MFNEKLPINFHQLYLVRIFHLYSTDVAINIYSLKAFIINEIFKYI